MAALHQGYTEKYTDRKKKSYLKMEKKEARREDRGRDGEEESRVKLDSVTL